jgi:hypothetical protein
MSFQKKPPSWLWMISEVRHLVAFLRLFVSAKLCFCVSSRFRVVTAELGNLQLFLHYWHFQIGTLQGRLLYHVDTLENFHVRLQKETTPHPQARDVRCTLGCACCQQKNVSLDQIISNRIKSKLTHCFLDCEDRHLLGTKSKKLWPDYQSFRSFCRSRNVAFQCWRKVRCW